MKKNPYELLGLEVSSNEIEIKAAYKKLIDEIKALGVADDDSRNKLIFAEYAKDLLLDPAKRASLNNSLGVKQTGAIENEGVSKIVPNFGRASTSLVCGFATKSERIKNQVSRRYGWMRSGGLLLVFDRHLVLIDQSRSHVIDVVSAMAAVGAVVGAARDKLGAISQSNRLSDSDTRQNLFERGALVWCEKKNTYGKKWLYKWMLATFSKSALYCPFVTTDGVRHCISELVNSGKNGTFITDLGCGVKNDDFIYDEEEVGNEFLREIESLPD